MDLITKLHVSGDGYDAIRVTSDQLTNRAHYIPIFVNVSTAQTAYVIFNHVWKCHG